MAAPVKSLLLHSPTRLTHAPQQSDSLNPYVQYVQQQFSSYHLASQGWGTTGRGSHDRQFYGWFYSQNRFPEPPYYFHNGMINFYPPAGPPAPEFLAPPHATELSVPYHNAPTKHTQQQAANKSLSHTFYPPPCSETWPTQDTQQDIDDGLNDLIAEMGASLMELIDQADRDDQAMTKDDLSLND